MDRRRGESPSLHLVMNERAAEVRGSFPLLSSDGDLLDRFNIRVVLPADYPQALPIVFETGGRIPKTADRHVFPRAGDCCVILEDTRWESFPIGASFRTYLDVPLRNYFLGQSLVERGDPWPFGDWSHGGRGILEYYSQAIESDDLKVVRSFVGLLALAQAKGHHTCFCGSESRLRDCCKDIVDMWRERVPPHVARRSRDWLAPAVLKRRRPRGNVQATRQ